jgi:hypothetical protein
LILLKKIGDLSICYRATLTLICKLYGMLVFGWYGKIGTTVYSKMKHLIIMFYLRKSSSILLCGWKQSSSLLIIVIMIGRHTRSFVWVFAINLFWLFFGEPFMLWLIVIVNSDRWLTFCTSCAGVSAVLLIYLILTCAKKSNIPAKICQYFFKIFETYKFIFLNL